MDRATSSTDAYVVVRFPNDTTWTSQVARKSLDPEWDETVIRNIGDDKYVRGLQLYVLGRVLRGCCWVAAWHAARVPSYHRHAQQPRRAWMLVSDQRGHYSSVLCGATGDVWL